MLMLAQGRGRRRVLPYVRLSGFQNPGNSWLVEVTILGFGQSGIEIKEPMNTEFPLRLEAGIQVHTEKEYGIRRAECACWLRGGVGRAVSQKR